MADLATVFHWSPETMDGLSLAELMDWRERARLRSTSPKPDKKHGA